MKIIKFFGCILIIAAISSFCSCSKQDTSNIVVESGDAVHNTTALTTTRITVRRDTTPVDEFDSVAQMKKKASTYKTIDDIYKSAGYEKSDRNTVEFSENTLGMIFKDKYVLAPVLPDGTTFESGGLYPHGHYVFKLEVDTKKAELWIDLYKETKYFSEAHLVEQFTAAGKKVYKNHQYTYYWQEGDYWVQFAPQGMDSLEVKAFISALSFDKVKIG